jgi:hypothetical protein
MKSIMSLAIATILVSLAGCSSMQLGGGNALVSGSAGQDGNAREASHELVTCPGSLGTIALVESQSPGLAQMGLSSPIPLIRLLVAQSRCFDVVERGQALTRMKQERQLAQTGLLQDASNIGGGQMVGADFMITPNVVFSENHAGAIGGALGSLIPGVGGLVAGAVMGGLRFKEAQAVMMVTDTRTGVQTAIAEGRAKATDLGGGLGLGSINGLGSLGGSSNTNEGKVVTGALLDAFNKLVAQLQVAPNR